MAASGGRKGVLSDSREGVNGNRISPAISIVRCTSYDRTEVYEAFRRSVDAIGGIGRFVRAGERVLLKPNLLKASRPEAAVTTHPEIVRAAIRLVREAGGVPSVGDSPGLGDLRKVAERSGILAVLAEEGVPLVELCEPVVIRSGGRFQRIEISGQVHEADAIINLPKLKTHGMTVLTGAVKNLFGCIPGRRKVQWHFNTGVDHRAFMLLLVELMDLVRPRLSVMDAVIGMEGNGPGSGDPCPIGVVMGGEDPVALDAVAGAVVGVASERLPVLRAARDAGIGEPDLSRIQIRGEPIARVALRQFRLPPQEHLEWKLPEWLRRSLKDALTIRPVIDRLVCSRCGVCRSDCPQQAIAEDAKGVRIDHRRCIRCYCCQEFCPQGAISIRKGLLLRLIGG